MLRKSAYCAAESSSQKKRHSGIAAKAAQKRRPGSENGKDARAGAYADTDCRTICMPLHGSMNRRGPPVCIMGRMWRAMGAGSGMNTTDDLDCGKTSSSPAEREAVCAFAVMAAYLSFKRRKLTS